MTFWREYWDSGAWILFCGATLAVLAAVASRHPYVIFVASYVSLLWGVVPIVYLVHYRRTNRC